MGLLVDTISWPNYDRLINDWILGDDRYWCGDFLLTLLPVGDTGMSDMYLTIKSDPTLPDSQCLLQIHATPVGSPYGIIVNGATEVEATLRVLGADVVNGGIAPGPYYYDIRGICTPSQATWTFEDGQLEFVQNVTGVEAGGTPAALPHSGNPAFRGFVSGGPPILGTYNVGDWVMNATPTPGAPTGWACQNGGPGNLATWLSIGVFGDDEGNI